MNDWSYGCIAKLLARAVADAATRADGTLGGRMSCRLEEHASCKAMSAFTVAIRCKADMCSATRGCPLSANSGHRHLYSTTSSARASNVGGMVRPSALAVLRLMTSSYLVGACTGMSAGFSPLRMRST